MRDYLCVLTHQRLDYSHGGDDCCGNDIVFCEACGELSNECELSKSTNHKETNEGVPQWLLWQSKMPGLR